MIEKFYKSRLHKTGNTKRRNRESSCKLRSSWWRPWRPASKKTQKVRDKVLSSHNSQRVLFKAKCRRRRQPVLPGNPRYQNLPRRWRSKSTKRIAGRKSSHYSSAHLPPSRIDYSQPFTPTEKVDSPFQPLRPAEGTPKEHIPSTSAALSDTRSVIDESTSKMQEAEKFESEQWAQAPRVKPVLRTNSSSSSSSSMPVAIFWKAFELHRLQQTSTRRLKGASRPEKADGIFRQNDEFKSKLVEDCKVGPEDWLVQNFVLWTTIFTRQQWICPIIQRPWRGRIWLRRFFFDRATAYANQRNQLITSTVKEKSPNKSV